MRKALVTGVTILQMLFVAVGEFAIPASSARAAFVAGDHETSVLVPGTSQDSLTSLSLSATSSSCDPLFGGCQNSAAAADISSGSLHAYADATGGGPSGFGDAFLSVPIVISGPVTVGTATITMTVHGTWQVGSWLDPHSHLVQTGNAQLDAYLYRMFYDVTPPGVVEDHLIFTSIGNGNINETLVKNIPFDLSSDPIIQLAAELRATANNQATMDLSHTATFSITVPEGDTYSTILGSAASVPEPASISVLSLGAIILALQRRRL